MNLESRSAEISAIVTQQYGIDQHDAADIAYNLLEHNPSVVDYSDEKLAEIVATLIEYS